MVDSHSEAHPSIHPHQSYLIILNSQTQPTQKLNITSDLSQCYEEQKAHPAKF
jgi:hypothetical protein